MNIELLTLLIIALVIILLFAGFPFAFTLGSIGVLVGLYVWGGFTGLTVMAPRVFRLMISYALVSVPMFILMASMLEKSGVAEDLYEAMYQWLGAIRGGLAAATILACTLIAAMTGIIGAGVVSMGLVAIPPMLKRGYDKHLAMGSVMAGGSLGTLIPPSVPLIIYGMEAGVSIGRLFMAGVFPGLMLAALYVFYILIRGLIQPKFCPALPKDERVTSIKAKLALSRKVVAPMFLVILVLGSIYAGIAGITEVSALGAAGAILITAARRRLTWSSLKDAVFATMRITCMVMWIFFGAMILVSAYYPAGGGQFIKEQILGVGLGPLGIIVIMALVFVVMGFFFDWLAILLLTMPAFVPIVQNLGFDLIWFGIVYLMCMQTAYLTPPFGGALFYLRGIVPPHITMIDIMLSVPPFVALQLVGLGVVIAFPDIALWLPGKMIG